MSEPQDLWVFPRFSGNPIRQLIRLGDVGCIPSGLLLDDLSQPPGGHDHMAYIAHGPVVGVVGPVEPVVANIKDSTRRGTGKLHLPIVPMLGKDMHIGLGIVRPNGNLPAELPKLYSG